MDKLVLGLRGQRVADARRYTALERVFTDNRGTHVAA
jgi:hypothetical protein